MRRDSSVIVIIVMSIISILSAVAVFLFGKFSANYSAGEEFRLVSVVFAIFTVLDLLFYWNRRQSRKNKYFKLTRTTSKEPDSVDYQAFQSSQKMFLYLMGVHFVLLIIFSCLEFFV